MRFGQIRCTERKGQYVARVFEYSGKHIEKDRDATFVEFFPDRCFFVVSPEEIYENNSRIPTRSYGELLWEIGTNPIDSQLARGVLETMARQSSQYQELLQGKFEQSVKSASERCSRESAPSV